MTTYRLRVISDLLRIPVDRLDRCMMDLQHGVELTQFALGGALPDDLESVIPFMDWTDDDSTVATIRSQDGRSLRLEVIDDDHE